MKKFLSIILIAAALVAVAIVAVVIITPHYVENRVNQRLATMKNHEGSIASASVNWFAAEIELQKLIIRRKDSAYSQPLISTPTVVMEIHSVAPTSSSLVFESPQLFAAVEQNSQGQLGLGEDWLSIIDDIVPLPIRQAEVRNGEITALFNLPEDRMQSVVSGIDAMMEREGGESSADTVLFNLTARLQAGDSASEIEFQSSSRSEQPMAYSDMQLSIATTPLPPFNPLLRHYGDIDVNSGAYRVDLNARVRDKQIDGTLNTKLTNLDVLSFGRDAPASWLFEGFVGGLAALVGEGPDNAIELEIPISGVVDDTQLATRQEIMAQLKNIVPSITDWSL